MQVKTILIMLIALSLIGCAVQEAVEETESEVEQETESIIAEAQALDNIMDDAFQDLPEPAFSPPAPKVVSIEGEFKPNSIAVGAGKPITWEANDEKKHLIACYRLGKRIVVSELLQPGDSFTHTFDLRGEVLCIDSIYGHRGMVVVEPAVINSITGNAILLNQGEGPPPLGVTILLLGMLVAFSQIAVFYKK